MKATEKYFPIRLLTLYKVVQASFESACQIIWCDHFKSGILTLFSTFLGILQGKMFSNFGIFALLEVNEIYDIAWLSAGMAISESLRASA